MLVCFEYILGFWPNLNSPLELLMKVVLIVDLNFDLFHYFGNQFSALSALLVGSVEILKIGYTMQ